MKPVTFVGRTYVLEHQGEDDSNCVCIDSEDTKGIVLMFFAKQDAANAHAASMALNLWAGFEIEIAPPMGPSLIKN